MSPALVRVRVSRSDATTSTSTCMKSCHSPSSLHTCSSHCFHPFHPSHPHPHPHRLRISFSSSSIRVFTALVLFAATLTVVSASSSTSEPNDISLPMSTSPSHDRHMPSILHDIRRSPHPWHILQTTSQPTNDTGNSDKPQVIAARTDFLIANFNRHQWPGYTTLVMVCIILIGLPPLIWRDHRLDHKALDLIHATDVQRDVELDTYVTQQQQRDRLAEKERNRSFRSRCRYLCARTAEQHSVWSTWYRACDSNLTCRMRWLSLCMYYFTIMNISAAFYSCYRTTVCDVGVNTGDIDADMIIFAIMAAVASLPILWFVQAVSGFIHAYFLRVPRIRLTAFILSLVKNKARAEKDHELKAAIRHHMKYASGMGHTQSRVSTALQPHLTVRPHDGGMPTNSRATNGMRTPYGVPAGHGKYGHSSAPASRKQSPRRTIPDSARSHRSRGPQGDSLDFSTMESQSTYLDTGTFTFPISPSKKAEQNNNQTQTTNTATSTPAQVQATNTTTTTPVANIGTTSTNPQLGIATSASTNSSGSSLIPSRSRFGVAKTRLDLGGRGHAKKYSYSYNSPPSMSGVTGPMTAPAAPLPPPPEVPSIPAPLSIKPTASPPSRSRNLQSSPLLAPPRSIRALSAPYPTHIGNHLSPPTPQRVLSMPQSGPNGHTHAQGAPNGHVQTTASTTSSDVAIHVNGTSSAPTSSEQQPPSRETVLTKIPTIRLDLIHQDSKVLMDPPSPMQNPNPEASPPWYTRIIQHRLLRYGPPHPYLRVPESLRPELKLSSLRLERLHDAYHRHQYNMMPRMGIWMIAMLAYVIVSVFLILRYGLIMIAHEEDGAEIYDSKGWDYNHRWLFTSLIAIGIHAFILEYIFIAWDILILHMIWSCCCCCRRKQTIIVDLLHTSPAQISTYSLGSPTTKKEHLERMKRAAKEDTDSELRSIFRIREMYEWVDVGRILESRRVVKDMEMSAMHSAANGFTSPAIPSASPPSGFPIPLSHASPALGMSDPALLTDFTNADQSENQTSAPIEMIEIDSVRNARIQMEPSRLNAEMEANRAALERAIQAGKEQDRLSVTPSHTSDSSAHIMTYSDKMIAAAAADDMERAIDEAEEYARAESDVSPSPPIHAQENHHHPAVVIHLPQGEEHSTYMHHGNAQQHQQQQHYRQQHQDQPGYPAHMQGYGSYSQAYAHGATYGHVPPRHHQPPHRPVDPTGRAILPPRPPHLRHIPPGSGPQFHSQPQSGAPSVAASLPGSAHHSRSSSLISSLHSSRPSSRPISGQSSAVASPFGSPPDSARRHQSRSPDTTTSPQQTSPDLVTSVLSFFGVRPASKETSTESTSQSMATATGAIYARKPHGGTPRDRGTPRDHLQTPTSTDSYGYEEGHGNISTAMGVGSVPSTRGRFRGGRRGRRNVRRSVRGRGRGRGAYTYGAPSPYGQGEYSHFHPSYPYGAGTAGAYPPPHISPYSSSPYGSAYGSPPPPGATSAPAALRVTVSPPVISPTADVSTASPTVTATATATATPAPTSAPSAYLRTSSPPTQATLTHSTPPPLIAAHSMAVGASHAEERAIPQALRTASMPPIRTTQATAVAESAPKAAAAAVSSSAAAAAAAEEQSPRTGPDSARSTASSQAEETPRIPATPLNSERTQPSAQVQVPAPSPLERGSSSSSLSTNPLSRAQSFASTTSNASSVANGMTQSYDNAILTAAARATAITPALAISPERGSFRATSPSLHSPISRTSRSSHSHSFSPDSPSSYLGRHSRRRSSSMNRHTTIAKSS